MISKHQHQRHLKVHDSYCGAYRHYPFPLHDFTGLLNYRPLASTSATLFFSAAILASVLKRLRKEDLRPDLADPSVDVLWDLKDVFVEFSLAR
jgi:hypothetical protein